MQKIIGYVRVSTDKQGRSGLGLEAQVATIAGFAGQQNAVVLRTYVEVESGANNDRPELSRALAHAKRSKATLAVAVLDRLGRNSLLVNKLLDSGVEFVNCQSPHDPPLVTRIKAAIDQEELEKIRSRTKAALAAYKARGGKLGSARPECRNNLTQAGRLRGAAVAGRRAAQRAREAYADLVPAMRSWRAGGASYAAIATLLNSEGHTTRNGKSWSATQVNRVLTKYAELDDAEFPI